MVRRVARRLGPYLLVVWAAVSVSFALPRLAPGEPLDYLLGSDAGQLTPGERTAVLAQYGLDRSVPEQYLTYLAGIATGDLGTSVRSGRAVGDMVLGRLGWTLALAIPALLLGLLIGVPAGAVAAWRRRRSSGVAITGAALVITSVPAFWLGLMLMAVLATGLGWFPVIGSLPLPAQGAEAMAELVRRLALPVLTLTAGTAGWMLLTTRAAVEGTLGEAYLQLARANGIAERSILWRHALRNALLPVVTNAGLALGALVGGVVVVETVFSVPGLGSLLYSSVLARDYPALQGAFLVMVAGVVGANLLADVACRRLDPPDPMTADAGFIAAGARAPARPPGRRSLLVGIGAGTVTLMSLLALVGPEVARGILTDGIPFEAPSPAHLLGTDDLGHDLLSLLLVGGRSSLVVALAAAVIATVLGATLGLVAGLEGGRVDTTIARCLDVMLALPFLPLVIVVGAFLGRGLVGEALIIGVAWSAHTGRIVRSQALEARSRPHVETVRAMGASAGWVARRHLLPIVTPLLVPQFVRAAGAALIAEASIAFLGLGDPTVPSWGGTIAFGQARGALLTGAWVWWIVPPGACIALIVSALAMLGFGLEERLQPRIARWGSEARKRGRAGVGTGTARSGDPRALLEVSDMSVTYATRADDDALGEVVRSVGLTVAPGETVGIVGESGSGKSTLAMALLGLGSARVTRGWVRFEGRDLRDVSPDDLRALRGGRIGIVPQDAMQGLDPVHPVGDQVAEVIRAHASVGASEARRRADAMLARVGIGQDRSRAYPHELSGGMRQRVVIAMALGNDPVLLIADEPTTGLDVIVQREIVDLLAGLRDERGMAMLIVTHDLPTVARLADRVLVMAAGSLVEDGDVRSVLGAPRHAATARLVAAVPTMPEGVAA